VHVSSKGFPGEQLYANPFCVQAMSPLALHHGGVMDYNTHNL
jgi:hypothetical protein